MRYLIVPNTVNDRIMSALDKALLETPDAEDSRQSLYNQLLDYYDEHGHVPEFSLEKEE